MEKEPSEKVSSFANDNEGHRDGELILEYDSESVDTIVHATTKTAVNCFRTATSDSHHAN
jgi:hypothetical protein